MLILSDPVVLANAHFLVLAGLVFIVFEFMLPTKGALGIVGALCFVAGTLSLTNSPNAFWHLSWPMFCLLNILVLGTLMIIAGITLVNYNRKNLHATAPLLGQKGRVIEWTPDSQRVEADGAVWQAISATPLNAGDKITVIAQDNLILTVTPSGDPA